MITLRRDQTETVEKIRAAMRGQRRVLLRAPAGFGKTVVTSYIARGAVDKSRRVIFGVHRRELARQTAKTFERFGLPVSYIMDGYPYYPDCPIQIASVDTLRTRHELVNGDLFIADEAHLWMSDNRQEILQLAVERGAYTLPMTATPSRPDGKPLSDIADIMVSGPTERQLIDAGNLAKYRVIAPVRPELIGLKKTGGEYSKSSIDEKFPKTRVVSDAIRYYREYAFGKRHVGYVHSRERGRDMTAEWCAAGIPSVFLDGETSDDDRRDAIEKFADGLITAIFNVALFCEGFDMSAQVGRDVPIQSVGLYAPTASLPKAIQSMMRCMRPQDGIATILDHASVIVNHDGTINHGFPDDDREWSLQSPVKSRSRTADPIIPTTVCGHCFSVYRPTRPFCPHCGCERDIQGRIVSEVIAEMHAIELSDIRDREESERENKRRRMEIGMAKTVTDICQIAVDRGYERGWVLRIARAKKIPADFGTIVRTMKELSR